MSISVSKGTIADRSLVVAADGSIQVAVKGSDAQAFESVTVAATAQALTSATVSTHTYGVLTLETASIRFRLDGVDPTAAEGHLLQVGDTLILTSNADLLSFRGFRTGATSGVLKCTYSGVA